MKKEVIILFSHLLPTPLLSGNSISPTISGVINVKDKADK